MPSRCSDEQKAEFSAADTPQMPKPTHEVFDVTPEYGDGFRRHRDTRSEESAVNFRLQTILRPQYLALLAS